LRNLGVNNERTRSAAAGGYMNATELADYLVRKGMAFRDAHEVVGKIVTRAIDLGVQLEQMELDVLRGFSGLIEKDVYEALSVERTLGSKCNIGGTAHAQVEEALREARRRL
jgi:argininosuccinate lyase / amino-acid N-acetyltransferase